MNREDVIRTYKQVSDELCGGKEWCLAGMGEPLERFAALIAAAEREECAKVCENFQHIAEGMDKFHLTNAITAVLLGEGIARCVDAIRARRDE